MSETLTRRSLLTGQIGRREHHISSAVVVAIPRRIDQLATELAALPGVEVHGRNESRLVIVIEGSSSGQLGAILASIALMDGVVSANMVFEQMEELSDNDEIGTHPA